MEKPYFKIDDVDIIRFIQGDGLKWERTDIDSPNSKKTMDGTMHRGRVAQKYSAGITCMDMNLEDARTLMKLINPEFVTVETNLHPIEEIHAAQYYVTKVPATISYIDPDTGESMWTGISFTLSEQ